jgi:hypothetical protein
MLRVRVRDSSSWFVHRPDGVVELHVIRRDSAERYSRLELVSEGVDEADAELAHDLECRRRAETSVGRSRRRANWGPRATQTGRPR